MELLQFFVFFLQQLPLLLSMLTTMWVAVKRCPLFLKGGIVAIIALFLSLFVATTPIVASPALGAIDHIELAHANNGIIPIKPEGRIKERHIPPRLVKSGGQWRTTSSMHWFSDEKPVSLMLPPNLRGDIVVKAVIVAALIAVTIDGATMPPPGGVLDGMAMMSIAPIVKQRGEGSKSALVKLFGPTWSVTGFGSAPYSIFKAVWEATMATPYPDTDSEGNWNIRTEFSHCNDLPCVIDLENLTDRSIHRVDIKGVPYDLLEQIFADTKNGITTIPVITGEVICLFGITPEEIMEVYDLNYSRKLWSKYLGKELPAHRANWAVVDSSTVEVVEALTDPDDDGTLILFGPKEGIDEFLGTPMPRNTTGMGMRVFGETLTKGRCRVVYSDNKDSKRLLDLVPQAKDKVVIVSHPDNNKGTMGRKIDGELLVTWWFYQQRPKAGTSGPQFLAQWAGQWGKTFLHTAMAMVWTSAHGALEAIRYGRLDEGLLVSDERKELLGFALRCRQAFMERLLLLNIPLAVSSNLLMLIKPLIREWKICLRRFKECAQEWNMALPWSCAAIVLSSSARSLMGSVPKGMRNKKLWWCKHFKELILDKSVMEEVKRLAPKTDLGDRDGDMIFCWLVFDITSGKYVVLVSRHPVGVGGFVVLQLDEVSVPWQNIVQKDKNGVEFSLLPLRVELPKTSDQYDWTEVSIDVVDEDEPAFGPIKDWAEISAYEAKKAAACPGLGMAINNMTLKLIHDHDLKPISTELLADFSQSGAGNVKAMKALQEVVKASGSDVREWEYVDRAAVAKYNCKTTDKNGEVVANIVDGSFTKLIESVSAEYRAAHQWLQKNLDTHVSARNSEALLSLTEKAGLSPNTEDAAKALAWCEKYNVLNNKGSVTNPDFVKTLHARIDALEPKEAAETALGLYVLLCEAGRYDALVMWLFNEPTGFQEDCILGYIIAYLEMHTGDDDDPEGPNPEGDGPKGDDGWMLLEMAAEDATNCGTSEEPNDRTDEILFDAYHLPTREQMRSMKQKDLAEYCRINDFITGWSKFNKIALREELIQRIVECVLDDYNNNNDDDDPTPPNGGGDRPTNETNETDKVREWSVEYWHNMADWCGDDLCSASDYLREADKQREFDVEGHVNRKLHVVSMRQEKKIAERLRREGHFAYYIGRQMTIGNEKFPASQLANKFKHGSKEQNIADFKEWFDKNKDGHLKQILSWIVERSMRAMVQGKQVYLVCWCAPEACHGDVVKKYVVEKVAEAILEAEWYGEDQEPFEEFKSEVIYQAKDNELKKGEKVKMVKKKTVPIKRGGEEMKNLPSVGIWTDGACKGNPGRGGWGVVLNSPDNAYHFNFRKTISGGQANATNNRMELMAAIEGLKALKRPSKVSVYSDSQYVVKGITEWVNGWIAKGWKKADGKPVNNVDLWKELVELNKIHDVEWVWVKGHAGSPLNEMADKLANRGCEDFSRKEENYTNQQGSTLLDMVFVVAALLLMSSVAAAFGGMEGFMSMMYNVVVWREAVDGTHPWKRWNDKKRCKMPVLKKQMNGAKKCMHEVREMTLLSEEEKEEMECHYKTQMAFIQEEIEQLLSEEPTDRPLDINYKKSSVYSQKCGSKHVKTTPGKNKDKGYWVTHPNCRPDEPCKRACGGNIFKEDELIIRKGERVTLWYTPVKLSQVESYWGNKVVRKEA